MKLPQRPDWLRRALWLVAATMAYNAIEAVVALWTGISAGSVALVGFGLDSVIELSAGAVVLWRMVLEARGSAGSRVAAAERRVHRFVGLTFFALAAYVAVQSVVTVGVGDAPSESRLGILLAVVSLTAMPLIAWGKFRAARAVNSRALEAEAKETLACSYLSLCLLLGLAANAVAGWWWADPIAAIFMVPWLIHEGREGLEEGDAC
jgi:divalent metal cation (Fe/Co/Zn/Cd) transporter